MQKAAVYNLKLAVHGTVNNTDGLVGVDDGPEATPEFYPAVKAEKDDSGWILWTGSHVGRYLVHADRTDDDVICLPMPVEVILYLLSEFLFGQFLQDLTTGELMTREQCKVLAGKELTELGYNPKKGA